MLIAYHSGSEFALNGGVSDVIVLSGGSGLTRKLKKSILGSVRCIDGAPLARVAEISRPVELLQEYSNHGLLCTLIQFI